MPDPGGIRHRTGGADLLSAASRHHRRCALIGAAGARGQPSAEHAGAVPLYPHVRWGSYRPPAGWPGWCATAGAAAAVAVRLDDAAVGDRSTVGSVTALRAGAEAVVWRCTVVHDRGVAVWGRVHRAGVLHGQPARGHGCPRSGPRRRRLGGCARRGHGVGHGGRHHRGARSLPPRPPPGPRRRARRAPAGQEARRTSGRTRSGGCEGSCAPRR